MNKYLVTDQYGGRHLFDNSKGLAIWLWGRNPADYEIYHLVEDLRTAEVLAMQEELERRYGE